MEEINSKKTNDETFKIEWRVHSTGNDAVQPYYTIEVDVFTHTFSGEETERIMVAQNWLDEHERCAGANSAKYAKQHIDATVIPADGVFTHPRIEKLSTNHD